MQTTSISPPFLLHHLDDPAELEARYRDDPRAFSAAFSVAWEERPDDAVLGVWHARLDAEGLLTREHVGTSAPDTGWRWAEVLSAERARMLLVWTVGLIALAGLVTKIPWGLGWTQYSGPDHDYRLSADFHQRFAPFYILLPLLGIFALRYRPDRRLLTASLGIVGALLLVQALRPLHGDAVSEDAAWLATLHLPTLLISLGALLALGKRWRDVEARMSYLQLVGETGALAGLFLIGGVLLVGLTVALFSTIGVNAEELIFEWVVVFGALGVLPMGALMASQRPESARLAPLVARVFGPLALAVLAVYLPTLLVSGSLQERDTLLTLNIALLAVLALVLLMEAERPDVPRHWTDGVAAGLVILGLAADVAAFVFVAERLAEGGLTPNRLAVVGLNGLVAAHLAGLAVPLARRALRGGAAPDDTWTARFLTVYTLWGAAVVLVFPLVF